MKLFKKVTSMLGAFALSISLMPISISASGGTYYKGDIDGDGSVTLMDLAYLRNVLSGCSCSSDDRMTQRLDVNLDGIIDGDDVTLVSRIIIGDSTSTLRVYSTIDSSGNKTIIGFNARNPLEPNVTVGRRIDTDILQFIFENPYLS